MPILDRYVAPPMRKLWDRMCWPCLRSMNDKPFLRTWLNWYLVKGDWLKCINKLVFSHLGRMFRYFLICPTGQQRVPFDGIVIVIGPPFCCVFDQRMVSLMALFWICMSVIWICLFRSDTDFVLRFVNSLILSRPKKASEKAAENKVASNVEEQ